MSPDYARALHGRYLDGRKELGLASKLDEEVLTELTMQSYEWILVTADDFMPLEHSEAISKTMATITTIDGEWEKCCAKNELSLNQQQFHRETIQRWAHLISEQVSGSIRRYSPLRSTEWTARRNYLRCHNPHWTIQQRVFFTGFRKSERVFRGREARLIRN